MSWNDLRKGRYSEPEQEYFITFVCHNRASLFTEFELARIFCAEIANNECQCGCHWLTWVLMPDHFHGLLKLGESVQLSQVVKQLKGVSARNINNSRGRTSSIWQKNFFDRALRSEEDRKQVARYIVANPLRKGIVKNIIEYPFWNSIYL